MPTVLTVLLNYRTPDMTLRAARAALTAMEGLQGALVVVDNASGDGSEDLIAQALASEPWAQGRAVRLIQAGRNGGYGAGNNVGIRAGLCGGARPDYVYLLNSDAFPEPDAIRRLVAHLEATPQAGIAGSRIAGEDGAPHVTAFRFPSLASEIEGAMRLGPVSRLLAHRRVPIGVPATVQRVDWLAGASMLVRDSLLRRIGAFDETFFLYFEETDLCLRAARAGWQTHYVPQSRVTHIGSVSTGMKRWDRIPQYWLDSRWHYFAKNHGRAYAAAATALHALAGATWRLRRPLQGKPRQDPPRFLRDMLRHDLRALVAPRPAAGPSVPGPDPEETPCPQSPAS